MEEAYRKAVTNPKTEVEAVEQGRLLVVVIGIDKYKNWQSLRNAVNDAFGFQQILINKLGFSTLIAPLENETATKAAITSLVEDELPIMLRKDDNLILFFAGHGHTRIHEVGDRVIETGYLIPVEASASDRYSEYIEIDSFLKSVARLPAKHILVIFDSCHSGFALGEIKQYRDAVSYTRDLNQKVSRRVITSALREQLALDGGPIPNHSLFTGTLIHGFDSGVADTDSNGLITSSELGLFVQQRVGQASESQQTPDFGAFDYDDRGEMVIPLRNHSIQSLQTLAFSALQRGEIDHSIELVEKLETINSENPVKLYMQYKLSLIAGDPYKAEEYITRIKNLPCDYKSIPLSSGWEVNILCEYFRTHKFLLKSLFSIREQKFPVEIEILLKRDETEFVNVISQRIGDLNGYLVKDESVIRFRIKNRGECPMYIYTLLVNSLGMIEYFQHLNQSSAPFCVEQMTEAESVSLKVLIDKPEYFQLCGLDQFYFFVSPNKLDIFEKSLPSISVRTIGDPLKDYLDQVQQASQRIGTTVLNIFIEP